jgi:hypothetical protein
MYVCSTSTTAWNTLKGAAKVYAGDISSVYEEKPEQTVPSDKRKHDNVHKQNEKGGRQ